MLICGIEIKGADAILVVVETATREVVKTAKFSVKDSYDAATLLEFQDQISPFVDENNIGLIHIKKRQEKGRFAGGPLSFKIEGLIQVSSKIECKFLGTKEVNQSIKSYEAPAQLKKYMVNAFYTALA